MMLHSHLFDINKKERNSVRITFLLVHLQGFEPETQCNIRPTGEIKSQVDS